MVPHQANLPVLIEIHLQLSVPEGACVEEDGDELARPEGEARGDEVVAAAIWRGELPELERCGCSCGISRSGLLMEIAVPDAVAPLQEEKARWGWRHGGELRLDGEGLLAIGGHVEVADDDVLYIQT